MKEEQKQMIESYINAYNDFDLDGMLKDLHHEIVFENITQGKVDLKTEGIDAFKKQAESAKQYFKKRKQLIESWKFTDQIVTVEIDYKGVLAVDLLNGMKSGDTIQLKGKSEFVFKNNKIIGIQDKS